MRSRPFYTRHSLIISNVLLQRCHAGAACTSVIAHQPQSGSAAVLLKPGFEGCVGAENFLRARFLPFFTGLIHHVSGISGLTNVILKVLESPKYSSQIISRGVSRHGQTESCFIPAFDS